MKKLISILFSFFIFQSFGYAKDILQFDFPNDGWHKTDCPDGIRSKKCYVPVNQTKDNFNEMLIFTERKFKNEGLNAMYMLQKQLGKDFNNYRDIVPEYILKNDDNAMAAWCSKSRNVCSLERAFQGKEGVVLAIYINKMPHYSQNMFGQWSNILSHINIYDKTSNISASNLIELD